MVDVRGFLRDYFKDADARQRRAAGITFDFISTAWSRKLEKLERGEPIGVYWFTIRDFLTREQQSQGGRWVVQEDGTLMKDL